MLVIYLISITYLSVIYHISIRYLSNIYHISIKYLSNYYHLHIDFFKFFFKKEPPNNQSLTQLSIYNQNKKLNILIFTKYQL